MGAEGIVSVIKGRTPRDAYNTAHEQARYEHGSGGYTGSMAESHGFFIHPTKPLLRWEAEQIAEQLLNNGGVQKWEATALIAVAEATATRKITISIDTTGLDWEKTNAAVLTAIRTKLRAGESIESVQTDTKTQTKVVATAAEGDAKTVYIVKDQWNRQAVQFPTLTAAKAAAKSALERGSHNDTYTITKQTVKGDSEALVTVVRKTTKAATTITAVVGKPKTGAPTMWVTAGIYSS